MTSFREALATLPGVDPDASEVDALEAVRSVWTSGADHELAVRLGFASWEGLWSTFAGNHPSLAGLEAWAPTFRAEAWRAVGTVFGIDDQAPPGRRGRHVRGGAAPRPPGDRRHARRPRRGGRPPSGRPDHQRTLGHPAAQARAVRTGGSVRMGGDLGRARCRQARPVGLPRAARRARRGPGGLGHGRGQLGARRARRTARRHVGRVDRRRADGARAPATGGRSSTRCSNCPRPWTSSP